MLDLVYFDKALKITWFRRLLKSENASWVNIFETDVCKSHLITVMGNTFIKILHVKNVFWKDRTHG